MELIIQKMLSINECVSTIWEQPVILVCQMEDHLTFKRKGFRIFFLEFYLAVDSKVFLKWVNRPSKYRIFNANSEEGD